MLKRKIYGSLCEWKKNKKKECLMIKGARQIGKTFIVRQFGNEKYKSFIEINFLKNPELKGIFNDSLDANEIYKKMTAYMPGIKLIPGDTLIFLDEIQKCASARTAVKFLAEDDRYDVIESGSLLGLHYGQDADKEVEKAESIPVGYERQMIMYSLDFEEFLWGCGYSDDAIDYLREFFHSHNKVPDDINKKYSNLLREYIVVGGMPEVVFAFTQNSDFNQVQSIQEKILSAYDDDISNHAKGAEKVKVRACYESLPVQLARENKKFKYSTVEKKATARKYGDSITWLKDAGLVNICTNVHEPYIPLMANEKENEFKLYMNDSGLLMSRYGLQSKLLVLNGKLLGNAKGGIYENLISEMLTKRGYSLHYYKTERADAELEFLIEKEGEVIPVEVKAGNTATVSLNRFIEKYVPSHAYKFIEGNIGAKDNKITLPHYMAMFI